MDPSARGPLHGLQDLSSLTGGRTRAPAGKSSVPAAGKSTLSSELAFFEKYFTCLGLSVWGAQGGATECEPSAFLPSFAVRIGVPGELVPRRSEAAGGRCAGWCQGPRALGGFLWAPSSRVSQSRLHFLSEDFGIICFLTDLQQLFGCWGDE